MKRGDVRSLDTFTGLKRLGVKDLSYKIVFIANSVHAQDSRFGFSNTASGEDTEDNFLKQFTMAERQKVTEIKNATNLYSKMANSISPTVYGHLDVKRGLLLQLFSGVRKVTSSEGPPRSGG